MTRIRDLLDRQDFETLFLGELGWDRVEDPDSMAVAVSLFGTVPVTRNPVSANDWTGKLRDARPSVF